MKNKKWILYILIGIVAGIIIGFLVYNALDVEQEVAQNGNYPSCNGDICVDRLITPVTTCYYVRNTRTNEIMNMNCVPSTPVHHRNLPYHTS